MSNLPPRVTHLKFGKSFTQEIRGLPHTITSLHFHPDCDQRILEFPPKLTHLIVGPNFYSRHNSPSNRSPLPPLPHSLEYLKVRAVIPPLPPNLNKLHLRDIDLAVDKLPISLQAFTVGNCNPSSIELPPSLTELSVKGLRNFPRLNLPPTLTTLKMESSLSVGPLPPSLTSISFGRVLYQPLNPLPPLLTRISMSVDFNSPIDQLPSGLTHLTFYPLSSFNQPVNALPHSLTHLTFGKAFNQRVDNLPPNLRSLSFGKNFNQPLEHLPPLLYLSFGKAFEYSHTFKPLPTSLRSLHFGDLVDSVIISKCPMPLMDLSELSDLSYLHYHPRPGEEVRIRVPSNLGEATLFIGPTVRVDFDTRTIYVSILFFYLHLFSLSHFSQFLSLTSACTAAKEGQ